MSHYLRKVGDQTSWTESNSDPYAGNPLIQAAMNKEYWLGNKSFHEWSIEDSEEGNTVTFFCPQTINSNDLERGAFYQVFASTDKNVPIAAFTLIDIQYEYKTRDAYVYKLTGKTWRDVATKMVIRLNESKISFKNLCTEILRQVRLMHSAFNPSITQIEDHNFVFSNYRAKAYLSDILKDLNDRFGYYIWFDEYLRFVGRHESTLSTITLDYDQGFDLHEKKITTQYTSSPAGLLYVKASNVISDSYTSDIYTANGTIDGSIFNFSATPAQPTKINIPFSKDSDLTNNFDPAPIGSSADSISLGRLQVNNLALGTFTTHRRNYINSFAGSAGITIGASLSINQSTGTIGVLGVQSSPIDQPSEWYAGFFINGTTLQVIDQGGLQSVSFPALIPTIRTTVTAINGAIVSLSSSSAAYIPGQTLYIEQDGATVDFGTIQSVAGNDITLTADLQINYGANMKALQQADYILKISYSPGSIIWYAKKGTDDDFTILRTSNATFTSDVYLQLYANDEHSISFDFLDIQENIEVFISKVSLLDGSNRNYDVAFEDSASVLQAEIQITQDTTTEKWQTKFADITSENIFVIANPLSSTMVTLQSSSGLVIGDRVLIDGNERFISGVVGNDVSWNGAISGLSINSLFFKTSIHPANGDIVTLRYKTLTDEVIPLCSVSCAAVNNKVPEIIDLANTEQLTYSEFRELANAEQDKICLPEIAGSYTLIIRSKELFNYGSTSLKSAIPFVGQKVVFSCPRWKPDFDGLESFVTNVKLISASHDNTYKAEIVFGNPNRKFDSLIYRLKGKVESSGKVINDAIPTEERLCSMKINASCSASITLSSATSNSFKNELYTGMINEITKVAYADGMSLSNVTKQSARNELSNGFINELAN